MSDDTGCLIRGIGVPIIFIVVFNLLPSSMDSTGRALLSGLAAWIGCGIVCLIFANDGNKGASTKSATPSIHRYNIGNRRKWYFKDKRQD